MKWAEWLSVEQRNRIDGWPVCRFAINTGNDEVKFVVGNARGSFGIWRKIYGVCTNDEPDNTAEISHAPRLLAGVTHLESGIGIAIFADPQLAAQACEALDRAAIWKGIDLNDKASFDAIYLRTIDVFCAMGVHVSPSEHCHDDGSEPLNFFIATPESIEKDRPAKPS